MGILRSIEAERSKLIDDVNRDVTMLKFSVKESLDKLQQKFIAKMLRKHVDYVNSTDHHHDEQLPQHQQRQQKQKKTLVRSPLLEPALGIIEEEEKEASKAKMKQKTVVNDKMQPVKNAQSPIPANSQSP